MPQVINMNEGATDSRLKKESPEYVKISLAAAMTLGIKPGLFHRNAKLHCINILLNYESGCAASCAYCGLSGKRKGTYDGKSFIRVTWPNHQLEDIISRMTARLEVVKRVCISQITNRKSIKDTLEITKKIKERCDVPVSVLCSPTILNRNDLVDIRNAGADKLGVAVDLATPELFAKFRGSGVNGPHKWDRYFECLEDAIAIFGQMNAGAHLITGMGETELEMVSMMLKVKQMGGWTHLFSFFPERESSLSDHPMPDMDHYRRIQLARYIVDKNIGRSGSFNFDSAGKIVDFGLANELYNEIVDSGLPFMTSGCEGKDGLVACNRPFANSRPGPNIRNFPFPPNHEDVSRIRQQMKL
jgi:lipoyl synthase